MNNPDPLATFSNVLDRPPGRFTRTIGLVSPGVREVAAQAKPYAQAWQQANGLALAASGPLWIALGDSMSQGIGASTPQNGWVGQAQASLARAGQEYRVVNLSMTGARTQEIIDSQLPTLAALKPDLVTVLVGSNDMMHPLHRRKLPRAFAHLIALLPAGAIVSKLPANSRPGREVNAMIAAAAAQRHVVAVSVHTNWRGLLASDHFHPNDGGYRVIADAFVAAIAAR